jgi:signal transduction histidine kinase/ligand-binding sensor domain-containing protein
MIQRPLLFILALTLVFDGSAQFTGPYGIHGMGEDGQLRMAQGVLATRTHAYIMRAPGLADSWSVRCIMVDERGTYWLGTSTGLVRLDGTRVTHYGHVDGDPATLPGERVTALAVDDHGLMYVATNRGLCRYLPEEDRMERIQLPWGEQTGVVGLNITQLVHANGLLWCSTWRGLFMFDPVDRWYRQVAASSLPGKRSDSPAVYNRAMLFPRDGSDPLVATDHGIMRAHRRTGALRRFFTSSIAGDGGRYESLYPAAQGRAWAVDRETPGIVLVDSVLGIVDSLPGWMGKYGLELPRYLHEDERGVVWVSYRHGTLVAIDRGTRKVVSTGIGSIGLQDEGRIFIDHAMEDRKGRLWLASTEGLVVLMPAHPGAVEVPMELLRDDVRVMCMHVGPTGELMIGTGGQGVHMRDPASGAWRAMLDRTAPEGSEAHRSRNIISRIFTLDEDRSLLATKDGVSVYRVSTGAIQRLDAQDVLLRNAVIKQMDLSVDGRLWCTTWEGAVMEVDTARWEVLRHFAPENVERILPGRSHSIACDHLGGVWLGLMDVPGLEHMPKDGEAFIPVQLPGEQRSTRVFAFHKDREGRLYAATTEGALWVEPESERVAWVGTPFTRSLSVEDIVGSQALGIYLTSGSRLAWLGPGKIHTTPVALRMNIQLGARLLALDSIGRTLWLNEGRRLVSIDLDRPPHVHPPAQVRLAGIRRNGVPTTVLGLAGLKADLDRLVFEFSVQDPIEAGSARVGYRLLPDTTWTECQGCSEIVLGELAPGAQAIELRVMEASGEWGPVNTLVSFHVRAPFWRTWWSRAFLVVLAALGGMALLHWRTSKRAALLRAQYERERLISDERLRIANDLHDELGSGLSVIKVKSELALERPEWNPPQETLRQVAESSTDLIHAMRQMIWTIRSGQAKLSDLIAYIRGYAVGYLADHGINCTFEAARFAQDHELTAEVRRAILLIVKEALHNVVKHAEADHVRIDVHNKDGLTIRIVDNGRGYNTGASNGNGGGVGLESMRSRASSIGGTLLLKNEVGTIVVLHVPSLAPGPNVPW